MQLATSQTRKLVYLLLAMLGLALIAWLLSGTDFVQAQVVTRVQQALQSDVGSSFSYQGYLDDGGNPASGSYDFKFALFDEANGGNQIGATQSETLTVSDGVFMVELNSSSEFGTNVFDGSGLFLEIQIWDTDSNNYVTLTPRQGLTAVPYAHFAKKVEPLGNIINVAKSGGDFTTITDALNAITDASETNPYLIRIAPGIYEESIELKSYVDIEGSGENVTVIRGTGGTTFPASNGDGATIRALNEIVAEIRYLTVESNSSNYATAIWTKSASESLKLKHITTKAITTGTMSVGILNRASSPTIEHVVAFAEGGTSWTAGIYSYEQGTPFIKDVLAIASADDKSYGIVSLNDAFPTITNATVKTTASVGTAFGIYNVRADSNLSHIAITANGTHDATGFFLVDSEITAHNMTITATSSGNNLYGVVSSGSSLNLSDASVNVSGNSQFTNGIDSHSTDLALANVQISVLTTGLHNYGIRTRSATQPIRLTDIVSLVSGGTNSYGIHNTGTIKLKNVVATAANATNAYGFYNKNETGNETATIDHSRLVGSTGALYNDSNFTTYIGSSKLDGDAINTNGGQLTCINSYDETYQTLTPTCTN